MADAYIQRKHDERSNSSRDKYAAGYEFNYKK